MKKHPKYYHGHRDDDNDNDKSMISYSQQQVEAECTSPCSSSAEICIAMCAQENKINK